MTQSTNLSYNIVTTKLTETFDIMSGFFGFSPLDFYVINIDAKLFLF